MHWNIICVIHIVCDSIRLFVDYITKWMILNIESLKNILNFLNGVVLYDILNELYHLSAIYVIP